MGVLNRTLILYSDDLGHAYAMSRAWDRWLVSLGFPPIYTSDPHKVGPILVNPSGTREHYEYCIDEHGRLRIETVLASGMQKAARSP